MIQRDTNAQWARKGDEFLKSGLYKKANRAYRKVIEADPQNANAWNNLGITLYASGSFDEAI